MCGSKRSSHLRRTRPLIAAIRTRALQRFEDSLVCQGFDQLEEGIRRAFSFPANEFLP